MHKSMYNRMARNSTSFPPDEMQKPPVDSSVNRSSRSLSRLPRSSMKEKHCNNSLNVQEKQCNNSINVQEKQCNNSINVQEKQCSNSFNAQENQCNVPPKWKHKYCTVMPPRQQSLPPLSDKCSSSENNILYENYRPLSNTSLQPILKNSKFTSSIKERSMHKYIPKCISPPEKKNIFFHEDEKSIEMYHIASSPQVSGPLNCPSTNNHVISEIGIPRNCPSTNTRGMSEIGISRKLKFSKVRSASNNSCNRRQLRFSLDSSKLHSFHVSCDDTTNRRQFSGRDLTSTRSSDSSVAKRMNGICVHNKIDDESCGKPNSDYNSGDEDSVDLDPNQRKTVQTKSRRSQFRRAISLFTLNCDKETERINKEKIVPNKILRPPTKYVYKRGLSGLPIECPVTRNMN